MSHTASTTPSDDRLHLLEDALQGAQAEHVLLRWHHKSTRSVAVEKGRVDNAASNTYSGIGVRVLAHGSYGFASTDRPERDAIRRAIEAATAAAKASARQRREKVPAPPPTKLARGTWESDGARELRERPMEALLRLCLDSEAAARGSSATIQSATCGYSEIHEEKAIVTSDGARALVRVARPELRLFAVAAKNGQMQRGVETSGVTGGWQCLFQRASAAQMADSAARKAVELLEAERPQGGRATVILSPALVGMLVHEAVGHTVEADFVLAGSVARGRIGTRVASDLVTLEDSGHSEFLAGAGGLVEVDDEGVPTRRTTIIEQGMLRSYLHDRESAALFGVEPTGNARAWEYDNEPLIRMRNTYIRPGAGSLEELVAGTDDGWLLEGASNGQADSNGEFMFGTHEARRIVGGKLGERMKGVNISGSAFDVLQTVDAVTGDFRWDLGSGHCGKGQPAKVDAGGPWLRCKVVLGGKEA
jgi:TldD protein